MPERSAVDLWLARISSTPDVAPAIRLVPPSPPGPLRAGAPQVGSPPLAESGSSSRRRGDRQQAQHGTRRPATPFARPSELDASDEHDGNRDVYYYPAGQGIATHESVLNLTIHVPRGASNARILALARRMVPRLPDDAIVVSVARVWSAPVLALGWPQQGGQASYTGPLLVPATHGIVDPGAGVMLPINVVYEP